MWFHVERNNMWANTRAWKSNEKFASMDDRLRGSMWQQRSGPEGPLVGVSGQRVIAPAQTY